jgi:outer membrane protein TolC
VPINDNRLMRPATDVVPAQVVLNWDQVAGEALAQRTELVRQRLRVRRRNLELTANRNFLLPRLDAVGRYRRRGFGDALYDPTVPLDPDPLDPMAPLFGDGGTDEWQIGMEMAIPIGFRQAHAGVRNAELALARERAVLTEMERQVIHDLSNAVAEQKRSYQLVETAYNRRAAAERQFELLADPTVRAAREIEFNLLLDAARRLAEAESNYNRVLVGYAVALKNVHVEAGDLMQYCNVHFADGG